MNERQIEYWNGQAGAKWAHNADRLDSLLEPFLREVLGRTGLAKDEHVLDVGCGAGAMTIRAAEIVGPTHGATGVDVSQPLIDLARARAAARSAPATFEQADASTYRAAQPVDAIVSRFGVMFFEDPEAAFANLRGSVRPEGRLTFACWQSLSDNDWARAPIDVILPMLKELPETPPPGAPGPFAFADKDRVARLLDAAGWRSITIDAWLDDLRMPGDSVNDAANFMMEIGPTARLVAEAGLDESSVRAVLIEKLAALGTGQGVHLPAAAWIVSATAT